MTTSGSESDEQGVRAHGDGRTAERGSQGDGGGSVDVTEADREKAADLTRHDSQCNQSGHYACDCGADAIAEDIAAALAEEREKARAPFLAVMRKIPPDSPELRWVADQIQRAADGETA